MFSYGDLIFFSASKKSACFLGKSIKILPIFFSSASLLSFLVLQALSKVTTNNMQFQHIVFSYRFNYSLRQTNLFAKVTRKREEQVNGERKERIAVRKRPYKYSSFSCLDSQVIKVRGIDA